MTWVKLDDQFPINAKTRALTVEARYLFVTSLCWCAMQMNDGMFPASDVDVIATLAGVPSTVAGQLSPALWHPEGFDCEACADAGQTSPVPSGHVAVHCYLERNESRAQVEERRRKDRKRKASQSGTDSTQDSRRIPPVSSRPVPIETSVLSSSGNSRPNPQAVDDDVPSATWQRYAELKLETEPAGKVRNTTSWKATTRDNAITEHSETAARWWHEYDITPQRLAECLIDGKPPASQYRRKAPA